MALRIVELHGYATLQGPRHEGFLKFGVPLGGAFDVPSWRLGNRVVGNDPEAVGLELALCRMVIRAEGQVVVALTGALTDARQDRLPVKRGTPIWMQPGMTLTVGVPTVGMLVYIAVRGGLAYESVQTEMLRADTLLAAGTTMPEQPTVAQVPPLSATPTLEVIAGPQADMFDTSGLFTESFEVTRAIDRRGLRLQGPALAGYREIESEPCCAGAIQVTRDGQLIVIGPDGPTVGGYPKIAVLTEESLARVSQCRPGERIRFEVRR
jgi:biotin-dependent carboxylase-like uncharacterized protein